MPPPPKKKMVKPKVKRKGGRRRGITKSLTERTTATEEPMTEASLSVKSSPSGGMKIYADLTWNSFFCVWTRGDAGLIMNANLMKYIGPLTFVELGFVGFFRKKSCRNQVSREYAVYSFMHSVYSQYGFSPSESITLKTCPNCLIVDVLYLGECDYFDFNMYYKDQNV